MRKLTQRRVLVALVAITFLLVLAETIARTVWGFGDMVLYFSDPSFEYLAVPNQDRYRFGNRIVYNEHSMRSRPLLQSDSCIVLGFGDSVINGGTLTDQDSLATTMVEASMDGNIRFLNISAGSWGPDNCAAYLKKHGDFGARMFVLFVSSHDAHDNMTHELVVGRHDSYPDHQYPLALLEILDKYLIPRLTQALGGASSADDLMINKNGDGFNPGFLALTEYATENGIPLIVCLHAETAELEGGSFNPQGSEIISFCAKNNIELIDGLAIGETPDHYRDHIHLNEKGQKLWAAVLEKEIRLKLKSCLK